MKLSKTSTLAALAMAYLANQSNSRLVRAREVADHLEIGADSTLKILQCLSRQHLVQSQLGRGGGYRLDRQSGDISLLEVVEAIDGPITGDLHINGDIPLGTEARVALLLELCRRHAAQARRELQSVSVADLAECHTLSLLQGAA